MILDQYRNPVSSTNKLIHGASQNRFRGPQFNISNKGIDELITERDREVICGLSQRLYCNMGALKSVINQKAQYSVGNAWLPNYTGPDKAEGSLVSDWLKSYFYPSLDVRAGVWDWWQNLKSVSKEIDIRGDHFTLLTTTPDRKHARIKTIPAHSIHNKDAKYSNGAQRVKSGKYRGNKIKYGIIYDKNEKAIAYRVSTGEKQTDYKDIPARSIIHSFDPFVSDGSRGLPVASHSLEDLKHVLQSTEYERSRQLILSSIGLFVENDTGGPDVDNPLLNVDRDYYGDEVTTEEISPQIWYAKGGNGNKITQLKHETGGDSFESFHDRMIRSFVAGADWSYSLTWKPTGQGTAERGEILRAREAVKARQKILERWALRVVSFAYAIEVKNGSLPILEDLTKFEFTKPPRLSVDDGREAKMLMDGYRLGKDNMTDILQLEGRTYEQHLNLRIDEAILRKQKIEEAAAAGYNIDERELVMFTPNEVSTTNNNQQLTDE